MGPDIEDGMVALVTGGYKNIGMEISRHLKKDGHEVIATYRSDREMALEASEKLGIEILHADMSLETDVEVLFEKIKERGSWVGVLVNNVSSFPRGPLSSMDAVEFREAFQSSVFSSFYSIKRSLPGMRDHGFGRIINIGMAGAHEARAYSDVAAHASAKTALSVFSVSLASELKGTGITVNMISPGIVDRPKMSNGWRDKMKRISPTGRLIDPAHVAFEVSGLIEDGSVTGKIIDILQ